MKFKEDISEDFREMKKKFCDILKFSFKASLLERFYSGSDIVEISEGATIGLFIFCQIFVPVGEFSCAFFDKGRYTRPLRL